MFRNKLLITLFTFCLCGFAHAQGNYVTLSLNDESVGLELNKQLKETAEFGAQYLYHDINGSYADVKFNATHANGIHQIAIGGKGIANFTDHRKNAQALALGGSYRLVFSQQIAIHAQSYYAPSILSFSSLNDFIEFDGHLEFKPIPTLALLGGYRYLGFNYEDEAKLRFEDGFYFGMKFSF